MSWFSCHILTPYFTGYRKNIDWRNIDSEDDDAWPSQAINSNNPPTHSGSAYYRPSAVQPSRWASPPRKLPNVAAELEVERLVKGVPVVVGPQLPDAPLLLPFQSRPAPVQPDSVQAPPSSGAWQSGAHAIGGMNTDVAAGDNVKPFIYEEVSRHSDGSTEPSQSYGGSSNTAGDYGQAKPDSQVSSSNNASPPKKPASPWHPLKTGAQSFNPSRMNFPGGNAQARYQQPDDGRVSWQLQNPAELPQQMREPILPPAPPPKYIIQSRNGYQRLSYIYTNSRYTPEYAAPVKSEGATDPTPSQPAALSDVKNPQRYNYVLPKL